MRVALPPGVPIASVQRRLANMPIVPLGGAPAGGTDGSSGPVAVTCTPGASNSEGAWAQAVASLGFEAHGVFVWATTNTALGGANNSWLLDIGVGANPSEAAIIPNILCGAKEVGALVAFPLLGFFPVRIPFGSRVVARVQANAATPSPATAEFRMLFVRDSMFGSTPPTKLIDIGVQTANGRGQDFAVLGATNTKGSWVPLTTSCPQPLQGVIIGVQGGTDTAFSSGWGALDIGVGASGAEVVRLPDLPMRFNANEAVACLAPGFWPLTVPAGARISARYACSTTANDLDVALIGVPA